MSDNPSRRNRQVLVRIGCLAVVGFAAGIWAAATPAIGPLVRPALAGIMILGGLVFLSPFATSRPSNEPQRKARMRISVMGAALTVYGVAQIVPSVKASITLTGLTVFLMVAAASGFPKRMFPRA